MTDLIRREDVYAAIRSLAFNYDRIAAIRALPAVQPDAEWQPIETAPKNRVIDLWSVDGERYPDAVWGVCGDTEGWTDANDHRDLEGFTFTNWRDRPAKPATKGGDA